VRSLLQLLLLLLLLLLPRAHCCGVEAKRLVLEREAKLSLTLFAINLVEGEPLRRSLRAKILSEKA